MILDSHMYCFEPLDDPGGHVTGQEHLRWVQRAHGQHHQPAFRVCDRAPAPSHVIGPSDPAHPDALPDVNFRVDHERGRVVWTIDGEDFTKHFLPPALHDTQFTAHAAVAEMDYADVDVALLHTDPMLGRDSAYLGRCVQQYPDRLRSMAPVDEWRIRDETDAVINELDTAINVHGLHAIKFIPPVRFPDHPEPWDDGPYRPFWQFATSLRVPVFFTLGSGPPELKGRATDADHRKGYLGEQNTLMRWMQRYPDTVCSLTHGFPWRLYVDGERLAVPDAIWEPFENPNCNMEVSFPIRLGDLFDYPYRQVWPMLEQMLERIGADHLLWGTDMPFQNRFCTYRQSRQWIEKHCDFLSPQDLASLMGATAGRILGI
jgi:predicted TIM-barrel fold metal-dependent hydrolase